MEIAKWKYEETSGIFLNKLPLQKEFIFYAVNYKSGIALN